MPTRCNARRSAPSTKSLLLVAGVGSRLRPITEVTPKCLIPIAGKPLLEYWFDSLRRAGVRDVLINAHHLAGQVKAYARRMNETDDFRVVVSHEPALLGSAGTIRANRSWMEGAEECLIIYGDNLSSVDLGELLRFHQGHEDPLTMTLFRASNPRACGIAELDEVGRVIGFVEKPVQPKTDLANAGLYVATAAAYREIADLDAFDLGHDVLPRFVGRMRGWLIKGYHRDIGSPESLRQAELDARVVFGGGQGGRS